MKRRETKSRGATPKKPAQSWRERAGKALVRQRETARKSARVAAVGVLLAVAATGLWYSQQLTVAVAERFPIQRIHVLGEIKHVERLALEAALSPYMEESFFGIDLEEVRQTAESMTWIDAANVRKEWPNTLVVTLQERIPVANWGKNQFLSAKGEIFFAEHVQPDANLPTFIGMAEQAALIAQHYVQMQAVLKDAGLSITTLEMSDRISMTVKLAGGLTLVIDEKESLEKLQRFTAVYRLFSEEQRQQLLRVDLRYENGLAIKWKKGDGDTNAA